MPWCWNPDVELQPGDPCARFLAEEEKLDGQAKLYDEGRRLHRMQLKRDDCSGSPRGALGARRCCLGPFAKVILRSVVEAAIQNSQEGQIRVARQQERGNIKLARKIEEEDLKMAHNKARKEEEERGSKRPESSGNHFRSRRD